VTFAQLLLDEKVVTMVGPASFAGAGKKRERKRKKNKQGRTKTFGPMPNLAEEEGKNEKMAKKENRLTCGGGKKG